MSLDACDNRPAPADEQFMRICGIVGNGNPLKGELLLKAIADRLLHARGKHPRFAESARQALSNIAEEFDELVEAVHHETEQRQFDEALDVIATCVRFANKEHEFKR